jgi:hypothetical protein
MPNHGGRARDAGRHAAGVLRRHTGSDSASISRPVGDRTVDCLHLAYSPRQSQFVNGELQRCLGRPKPAPPDGRAGDLPRLRGPTVGLPLCSRNPLRSLRHCRPPHVVSRVAESPLAAPIRSALGLRSRAEQIADHLAADGRPPEPTVRRLPPAIPLARPRTPGRAFAEAVTAAAALNAHTSPAGEV